MRVMAVMLVTGLALAGCADTTQDDAGDGENAPFPPRTNARDKPVLMVHGFDFFGDEASDPLAWQPLKVALSQAGWNQPLQSWGYYGCDVGFDLHANDHGSHTVLATESSHLANACGTTSHTRETPIEHLAYHWAWTVSDLYASHGQCVDVVAHSMGGLIVRYALGQVQAGNPVFPTPFCVEDAVTLGTPHAGSELAALFAFFCPSVQCNQMLPGSPFLAALETAQSPGGYGGTDWTLVGSQSDFVVSPNSALGMSAAHFVLYLGVSGISHAAIPNYLADFGVLPTAALGYRDGNGDWRVSTQAHWPLSWVDQSLVYKETTWINGAIPPSPQTTRVYPAMAEGGVAPGREVEFQATCSDQGDLAGAVWSTMAGTQWQVLAEDTVQLHDNPWFTSQAISFPTAGTYKVRVECFTNMLGSSQVEWTITADQSYNPVPTASRLQPSAANVQGYVGDEAYFEAACANPDGDLAGAQWWTRPSGGAWSQTTTDTVQFHSDPWTTSQSYTLTTAGTIEVQVRCIDAAGSQSEATWTVQIMQRATTAPPGGPSGATRVSPATSSGTVARGASVEFEVACEDASSNLDRADWYTKSPGGNWVLADSDTVQFHANPWHSYQTYTFSNAGTFGIRVTCIKETGASASIDWTVTVQ